MFYINCPLVNDPVGKYYGAKGLIGAKGLRYCEGSLCVGLKGVCTIGGSIQGVEYPARYNKSYGGGAGVSLGVLEIFEVIK